MMLKPFYILVLTACLLSLSVEGLALVDLWKNHRGVQKYAEGRYDQSAEDFSQASEDEPGRLEYHYNLGNAYYRLNRYQEAEASFLKSLNSQNEDIRLKSLYNLGNTRYRQNDLKGALDYYEKALKIDPSYKEAALNRDFVLKKMQQQDPQSQESQNQGQQGEQDQQNQDNQGSQGSEDKDQPKEGQQGSPDAKPHENPDQNTDKTQEKEGQESSEGKSEDSDSRNEKPRAEKGEQESTKLPDNEIYRILESVGDNPGKALRQGAPLEDKNSRKKIEKPW